MAGTFKLVVKDGTVDYSYDKKGNYTQKRVDDVSEYDSLAEALAEFLYYVDDDYNERKVTLSFVPKKKK